MHALAHTHPEKASTHESRTHKHKHTQAHIHTHTYTYIHIHTHTYTHQARPHRIVFPWKNSVVHMREAPIRLASAEQGLSSDLCPSMHVYHVTRSRNTPLSSMIRSTNLRVCMHVFAFVFVRVRLRSYVCVCVCVCRCFVCLQ